MDLFGSELRAGLRSHYPDLPDDAAVDVVSFVLTTAKKRCTQR